MTCGDKLWSFHTPFRHSDTVMSDGTQRLALSSPPFVIQRRRARCHARNHLVPHFFTFCYLEAVGLMTCGEPFGPTLFHLLSSRGGGHDDMRRQIMVILHTFSPFRHSRVRWHAETNIVFCAFCHLEAAGPMTCGDKLRSFYTPFRHSDTVVSDGT